MRCKKLAVCILAASVLAACSEEKVATETNKTSPTIKRGDVTFEQYIEAKKIPDTAKDRQQKAFENFQERSAIANYILQKPLSDDAEVRLAYLETKNHLVINHYFDKFLKEKLSDDNLKQYFEANKTAFAKSEYMVSQLLLKITPAMDDDTIQKKLDMIISDYNQGENFAQLAEKYAVDVLLSENIEMTEKNTKPDVFQLLSGLKKDEISQPIASNRGIKLLQLVDRHVQDINFEEAKGQVKYAVKAQAKKEEWVRLQALAEQ